MDANEARRIGRRLGKAGDRDRAGVGGEDRGVGKMLTDAGEDRALDFLALGRRLDYQFGGSEGGMIGDRRDAGERRVGVGPPHLLPGDETRSEEHTAELQSLMRISDDVFCLKKKKK